jgi:MoaA/NifB/PqqE/SkfB family radical SAM enzyme
MNTWVELCWQITSDCNEHCKFCHFFPDKINALSVDDNAIILKNISECKIPAITWSGGEALLYTGLNELIRIARGEGIKNRLITNGQICNIDILQYLDELVISIDSIDPDCNAFLGRGSGHFDRVLYTVQKIQDVCQIPIRINTMVSNRNTGHLAELYNFIIQNNIYKWRISKFAPLRGRAKKTVAFFLYQMMILICYWEK